MNEVTKEYLDRFIKGEIDEFGVDIDEFDEVMEVIESHGIETESEADTPVDAYIYRKKIDKCENYDQYHFHTDYSNKTLTDSPTKFEAYCKRAVELGQKTITTVEHGYCGDILNKYDIANKYNLKLVVGSEFYITKNRFEKERDNLHIIILAKKKEGYRDINRLISASSEEDATYYRNRIDIELIKTLNPNDFIVTTACVGGLLKSAELFKAVYDHFGKNLYIELQNHDDDVQRETNALGIKVANKLGLKIIHANDSHYIKPKEAKLRDVLLRGRGLYYEEESNFILDYPDINTIRERYKKQGILTESQIEEALRNTHDVGKCEGFYRDRKTIKMPSLYPHESHEEKIIRFKRIVNEEFKKEIPRIKKNYESGKCPYNVQDYIQRILYETNIIEETHMEDYYLLNYEINKDAIDNHNGQLSPTARGSASSYLLNYLFRFTNIDPVSSKVKLYAERFMTVDRIKSGSLPDIDFNVGDQKPFVDSAKSIFGEHSVYAMISFGTLQFKAAFRLVCKAYNKMQDIVSDMAEKFDPNDKEKFENAYNKYVQDEEWKDILIYSKQLVDVIVSYKHHACAYLLLTDDIREEFGIVRTKKGVEVCCVDSDVANSWLYLKNDWLIVDVVRIIYSIYDKIGMKVPTVEELTEMVNNDEKVWSLYDNGMTKTLNQVGSDFSIDLVENYQPRTMEELSAFVASIRPGFASDRPKFINREDFKYGIPELDSQLQDSYGFVLYQENVMTVLGYAGIPQTRTYEIIKAISKKKEEKILSAKDDFINGFVAKTGDEESANKIWQIIYDSSKYSFNASHSIAMSCDSLYCAYPKAYYPELYFTTVMQLYADKDKDERDKIQSLLSELSYFNINIAYPIYGKASNDYTYDEKTRTIYVSLKGLKFINDQVADETNRLYDLQFDHPVDLFIETIENSLLNKTHVETLIKLDFFSPLSQHNKKLLLMYDIVKNGLKDHEELQSKILSKFISNGERDGYYYADFMNNLVSIDESIVKAISKNLVKYSKGIKSGEKRKEILKFIWDYMEDEKFSLSELLSYRYEFSGEVNYIKPSYKPSVGLIISIEGNFSNKRVLLYRPKDGSSETVYIKETLLNSHNVEAFDFIETIEVSPEPVRVPQTQDDGKVKWVELEGKFKNQLVKFNKIILK